jgi:hypothetical protein
MAESPWLIVADDVHILLEGHQPHGKYSAQSRPAWAVAMA